ncbi:MAG TPA: dockerin type I domain-containing protein [Phycisphaerae bacterium]|nr:dockerin type I domain-containing protein [Phycisphaerae bacterium]HRW53515.1 dockerin type I domain-containing protein [Phycisphaerae bacterium]
MRTAIVLLVFSVSNVAMAAPFELLVGVDVGLWPGTERSVAPSPGPGFPGPVYDGDRLVGTSDVGPSVAYRGLGSPLFPPNDVGALSCTYRRGSVPLGPAGTLPLVGVDFLGGPLLDLDGDLNNGARSLVPVDTGAGFATPVRIPGTTSFIDLELDPNAGTIELVDFEAAGTNEGGPSIGPGIATVLLTLAGTGPDGTPTAVAPNPTFDTRVGAVTPHGTIPGVYAIDELSVEFWYDSIEPNSSTASVLGTLQQFATFSGWLVVADCGTGQFPTLAGAGLGSTQWPNVDVSSVGQTFNTAHGLAGGVATITNGNIRDDFTIAGNGGLAMTDFGGDLGAYFDSVVVPLLTDGQQAFVYLESASFGMNNSGDPIYADTNAYDLVIVAAAPTFSGGGVTPGDMNGDGFVTLSDVPQFVDALLAGGAGGECGDPADANTDGNVNGLDVQGLVGLLN